MKLNTTADITLDRLYSLYQKGLCAPCKNGEIIELVEEEE